MSAGTFLPRNQWGEAAQLYVRLKRLDSHQELEPSVFLFGIVELVQHLFEWNL
jgi:hypothetical protein